MARKVEKRDSYLLDTQAVGRLHERLKMDTSKTANINKAIELSEQLILVLMQINFDRSKTNERTKKSA